jgi:DNA-binding NarL/FixJ family response regulator
MGRVPLVLLSDREDIDEIVEAIELGVRGYIPTSIEVPEAAAGIHCVEAGGTFVPASTMIRLAQDRQNGSRHAVQNEVLALQELTPRECQVLAHLRVGKPNKIIAHELAISESTVKVFVRRILIKMKASNRTEIAAQQLRRADRLSLSRARV